MVSSLDDARVFLEGFFNEYNHIHRHSGIAWHTPASVHFGTAEAVDEARQITLNEAYVANPDRFSRRPSSPEMGDFGGSQVGECAVQCVFGKGGV